MPRVTTRAVILQAFAYSETSKILRLLTPDFGMVSAIAKGARRPRSRFGGVLEPFTEGYADLFRREGRALHPLDGWELIRSRQALGRTLTAFAGASLLAELVLRFATEEPSKLLFGIVVDALNALATPPESQEHDRATILAAAWAVVAALGFAPRTDACVRCGRGLDPDEAARFDAAAGGSACAACRPRGRVLEAAVRRELTRMVSGEHPIPEPGPTLHIHQRLLETFLREHLTADRPLRSLDLLSEGGGRNVGGSVEYEAPRPNVPRPAERPA